MQHRDTLYVQHSFFAAGGGRRGQLVLSERGWEHIEGGGNVLETRLGRDSGKSIVTFGKAKGQWMITLHIRTKLQSQNSCTIWILGIYVQLIFARVF